MSEENQRRLSESTERITELLQLAADGVPGAREELYERIYGDLRGLAKMVIRGKPRGDLDTTDLIQEVVVRFEAGGAIAKYPNRRVLFSVAIRAMNQVLIDHYRRRKKLVDSPDRNGHDLDHVFDRLQEQVGYDFESLQHALKQLEATAPRQFSVLSFRIYGGFTVTEVAEMLEVSRQTVERDWKLARAKLFKFMTEHS